MILDNAVDIYINAFAPDIQDKLRAIRQIIQEEVPTATERICMHMPTYDLNGKWLIHFAAFKKHIGLFPQPDGVEAFKDRLTGYKSSKGGIQFPLDKPLPLDFIREIVRYKARTQ